MAKRSLFPHVEFLPDRGPPRLTVRSTRNGTEGTSEGSQRMIRAMDCDVAAVCYFQIL
jgi:hypothetical protein